MRIYIYFLLILLSLNFCSDPNSDLAKEGINGRVKSIKEIAYQGSDEVHGDSMAVEFSAIESKFNRKGFLIEKSYFDLGKMILKIVPQRKNNKLTGNIKFTSEGTIMLKSEIRQISDSVYEEISNRQDGKLFSIEKTTYRNNKKVITIINYQSLEYQTAYEYNKQGFLIHSEQKNNTGEEEYCYNYSYLKFDRHKNWTRREDYDSKAPNELKFTTVRNYKYY